MSIDLSDLVRQYGDERARDHEFALSGRDGQRTSQRYTLFTRIESEVQRLRAERDEALAKLDRIIENRTAWYDRRRAELGIAQQDCPVVLTLPEAPEGAAALIGIESGRRWEKFGASNWKCGADIVHIGIVLVRERPGVRVEMAPPPAPRTAAEIWEGDSLVRHDVRMQHPLLAEALDREAGITS